MSGLIDFALRSSPTAPEAGARNDGAAAIGASARNRLAAAIRELDGARAELAAAQEPATRLGAVIAAAAGLEAELAVLRAADEQRLGAWLAGTISDRRPGPSPETIAAEKRLAEIACDAAAARAALPPAEQAFRRCAERIRELQQQRDEAVCAAAIEAAQSFAVNYRAALTRAAEGEAALHGLRHELLATGNRSGGHPAALDAAARIGELLARTKRSATLRHDPEPGRRLLAALLSDPDAAL